MRGAVSLAVVGAEYPNKRGPTRRFEIAIIRSGESVRLVREPENPKDERAVAVFSARNVQIGYLTAERAALVAPMIDRDRAIHAVMQRATSWGCWIRVAFDGEVPSIEGIETSPGEDTEPEFWPDEMYPDE